MELVIDVIGIGADGPAGLRAELRQRIEMADFLAGGERQLSYFPQAQGERFILRDNLLQLLEEISNRRARQRCVVLASGDPLFYGIGTYLVGILGPQHVRIEPALSSMQLAFARAGISWQWAALASIHGRDLRATLLPLLGKKLIGLFTHNGESPSRVAEFFLRHGLHDYRALVAENVGAADEHIRRFASIRELTEQQFAPLNYLILQRSGYPCHVLEIERHRSLVPGIPDEVFAHAEHGPEVMTRQEVRSIVVGYLCVPTRPGDLLWDIGAGLGTISIELAVLRPDLEVLAVERDPQRATLLLQNRERFDAYTIRIIQGTAPEALVDETERPRLVFIGGSGGQLGAILDLVHDRLRPNGRLVASFVTLENLMHMLERVRGWRWPFEVTEIHVARSGNLAGLTGLKPQRGVFLVRADKPEAAGE